MSRWPNYHHGIATGMSGGGSYGGSAFGGHHPQSRSIQTLQTSTSLTNYSTSLNPRSTLSRPVNFNSINVASTQSANIRWSSPESVNAMDHLYFITNMVLDYLLENDLPQELMNQTLFTDPMSVLMDNRNELIKHFHKLLIAACTCLCVGISIPLFGFMIACCWCTGANGSTSKRSSSSRNRSSSGRHASRSRSHHRDSSDTDWLAASSSSAGRDPYSNSRSGGSRYHREAGRRGRRHGGGRNEGRSRRRSGSGLGHRSRSVPPFLRYESACHPCLRTFFSSNLFVMLLLISFFAVCAFVTNEYVDYGVKSLPKALNHSVDEVQVYLNNTDHEIDNLFRFNYNQLEQEINSRLDTSGSIIKHKLAISSEAIALANLTDIVSEFNDTKIRLERLDRELLILKSRLNTARKGLNEFKTKIENCPPEKCTLLRRKYANLNNFRILPRYEHLPDVKPLVRIVSQLIDSGIVAQVKKGKDNFDNFGVFIQREVNGTTPEIKQQLSVIGKKLSNLVADVSRSIRWSDQLLNQTRTSTKKLNDYSEYEQYRRYACLAGASITLFILLCYTLGWLYGSCRPQPTARTWKTRVKTSASASFPFSCGILTVFLLFLPLILATIVLFMTGSVGDKIVCRVMKHPEQKQSKQIYAMLQNKFLGSQLALNSTDEDKITIETIDGKEHKIYRPNYADLIARCHKNQSIYKVLKLDKYDKIYLTDDENTKRVSIGLDKSAYNLNSITDFKKANNFYAKLKDLLKQIDIDTRRISLLSESAEESLKNSGSLSFDEIEASFASLYDNGVTISPIDIERLIKDFQDQKAIVNDADLESDLAIATILATSYNDQIMPNITSSLLNLKDGVRLLKLRMFHGRNSFNSVITELIAKVRSAENQLRSEGKTLLKLASNEFIDELNALVDQYASHVKNQVENVIGQCEPVSRSLNSTVSALCDDIVLPFNGYWLSATASLILILPATLLAYALKGLYSLARRGPSHLHSNYSYTDQEDDISYEEDGEDIALAYHPGHPITYPHKPSSSTAAPSAPSAPDQGWSPSSQSYIHNSRPPPYAV